MQFFGFDLWKHLCKQANHVAAILNQKPCNFALIKFLAENHHVIVMWFLQILAIFKIKYGYRIKPPIRRFVYKTGAVFGPFPGRILLLINYKMG